jgi:hypothetical protein
MAGDEYMNLTEAESAALGYRVRRPRARAAARRGPARPFPGDDILGAVFVAVILFGMLAGVISAIHESESPKPVANAANTNLVRPGA